MCLLRLSPHACLLIISKQFSKLLHKQEVSHANCFYPIRSNGFNDQEFDTQAEEFFQLLSEVTEKEDLKVS